MNADARVHVHDVVTLEDLRQELHVPCHACGRAAFRCDNYTNIF